MRANKSQLLLNKNNVYLIISEKSKEILKRKSKRKENTEWKLSEGLY